MTEQDSGGEDVLAISLSDVQEAMKRIRPHVHYTPVMECSHLNSLSALKLFFKCELFQKAGSFKIRGVTNAIIKKLQERSGDAAESTLRVVAESGGNHAQALALAAKNFGVVAEIAMPNNSPPVKIRAVKEYGGVITLCPPSEQALRDATDALLAKYAPNAVRIPPCNHPDIMAGQGTIAVELLEQVSHLDAIVGTVGGGGLMSGVAVAAKGMHPDIKVFAAEPESADDCARSLAAGERIPNETWPDTVCDALRVSLFDKPWPILKTHLSGVITVSDGEVIAAMRTVWERMNITVEPAAACAVAAVLSPKFKELAGPEVKRVGVVLCGGNVDLDNLPWTH